MVGNKIRVLIVLLLVGFLGFVVIDSTLLDNQDNVIIKEDGTSLFRIKNYKPPDSDLNCDALVPECGYCPGEVINQECYVDKRIGETYYD